jgi:hypothetical protein
MHVHESFHCALSQKRPTYLCAFAVNVQVLSMWSQALMYTRWYIHAWLWPWLRLSDAKVGLPRKVHNKVILPKSNTTSRIPVGLNSCNLCTHSNRRIRSCNNISAKKWDGKRPLSVRETLEHPDNQRRHVVWYHVTYDVHFFSLRYNQKTN